MRFKLLLEVDKRAFGNVLPINYQYEQSAAIYRILSKGNAQYSEWLHNNGFQLESGKRFKLFTFSRFKIEQRQVLPNERLKILCDKIEWQISFLPEKSTEQFIQGIFANQIFQIGDKKSVVQFKVAGIEVIPPPTFEPEMVFETMSPMCIRDYHESDGTTEYLSPNHEKAKRAILTGLLSRYEAFYGNPYTGVFDFDFIVLNEPKSVLVKLKADTPEQTRIKGYMCRFMMKAPEGLMRVMYESGVGEMGAQGFGCVRVVKK